MLRAAACASLLLALLSPALSSGAPEIPTEAEYRRRVLLEVEANGETPFLEVRGLTSSTWLYGTVTVFAFGDDQGNPLSFGSTEHYLGAVFSSSHGAWVFWTAARTDRAGSPTPGLTLGADGNSLELAVAAGLREHLAAVWIDLVAAREVEFVERF